MNCWEYMNCSKRRRLKCPAYPDCGKDCWYVAGTLCHTEIKGVFAERLGDCRICEYYRKTNTPRA